MRERGMTPLTVLQGFLLALHLLIARRLRESEVVYGV